VARRSTRPTLIPFTRSSPFLPGGQPLLAHQGEVLAYLGELFAYQGEVLAHLGGLFAHQGEVFAYLGEILAHQGGLLADLGEPFSDVAGPRGLPGGDLASPPAARRSSGTRGEIYTAPVAVGLGHQVRESRGTYLQASRGPLPHKARIETMNPPAINPTRIQSQMSQRRASWTDSSFVALILPVAV
jgi:hypothetical protein